MAADHPPLTFRAVDVEDDGELDAFQRNTGTVFTAPWVHTPERREFRRPSLRRHRLSGAFDGDRLVATYRSWDWGLTVPGGGTTRADAVSSVTVLPTHRRRGALTRLITSDLAAARERGVPVAVLVASEASIYARFGFGPATETASWRLDVRSARIAPDVPRPGSLELLSAAELRLLAPAIFEAARLPGATDRSPDWWDVACGVTPWPGEPQRPEAAVVHRDPDGVPQGFARYTWQDEWVDRVSHSVVTVHDFQAATPAAYAALWGFLADLDLVATVRADDRPVDEALPWLLTDARAARRTGTADLLWVRILDPVAALTARRYERPGRVVLGIVDPLGHAAATLVLDVADDGTATAEPTAAEPEVTLPVDVLASLYLGAGDLLAAAVAGRAQEHAPGALHRLAGMLRTLRAPWTGTWF